MNDRSQQIKVVLAVVCLAAAVILLGRHAGRKPAGDFPDGLTFICTNCQGHITLEMKEFARIYREQQDASSVPCPHCGPRSAVAAEQCSSCGTLYEVPLDPGRKGLCPGCEKKSIP